MASTFEWHGDVILTNAKKAAKEGCHQAAEKIVANEWSKNIPWAEGILGGSITVTDTEEGAQVSDSGPYAAAQEFDALRHPDPTNPKSLAGRKAHAGRDALLNNQDEINQMVTSYVKNAL